MKLSLNKLAFLLLLFPACAVDPLPYPDCGYGWFGNLNVIYEENKINRGRVSSNPTNASEFLFLNEIDSVRGIYTYNLATGETHKVVGDFYIWSKPDWSVQDWIVFETGAQIFKVKSNGDSLTQLTFEDNNYYPSWSPDGEFILFERDLAVVNIQGYAIIDKHRNIIHEYKSIIYAGGPPIWSPDGSKIAFSKPVMIAYTTRHIIAYFNLVDPENVYELIPQILGYYTGYLEWYPDSKRLLCTGESAGVFEVNIETGVYTEVESFCPYQYLGFTILADGETLVLNRWKEEFNQATNTVVRDVDLLLKKVDGTYSIIPY